MDKPKYLYDRKGPWPQPNPAHPFGEAPAVVHIPKKEQRTWYWNIGLRYMRNMLTYWPVALWKAWKNPSWEILSDDTFCNQIYTSPLSKFLNDTIDDNLEKIFKEQLKNRNPEDNYYIADFICMKDVRPFEGLHVASSVVLFKKDSKEDKLNLLAIYIYETEYLSLPNHGQAWDLAKNYAMMGATYRILLSVHPILHFPFDSVNAITKTCLPVNNTVFKLLYPHFQFTLTLNNAVLELPTSPVVNHQHHLYAGFCGPQDGLETLLVSGYKGYKNNSSFPKYKWSLTPEMIHSDYYVYLKNYYDVFRKFTDGVVKHIPKSEHKDIKKWADYIAPLLPGFPDGKKIFEGDNLSGTLAKVMWDLSVAHATDHHDYGTIPINRMPLRMRVSPPSSENDTFKRKDQAKFFDIFRYALEWKLFFTDYTVTRLIDVDYKLSDTHLEKLQSNFIEDLRMVDKNMPVKKYMDLDKISVSIQY